MVEILYGKILEILVFKAVLFTMLSAKPTEFWTNVLSYKINWVLEGKI